MILSLILFFFIAIISLKTTQPDISPQKFCSFFVHLCLLVSYFLCCSPAFSLDSFFSINHSPELSEVGVCSTIFIYYRPRCIAYFLATCAYSAIVYHFYFSSEFFDLFVLLEVKHVATLIYNSRGYSPNNLILVIAYLVLSSLTLIYFFYFLSDVETNNLFFFIVSFSLILKAPCSLLKEGAPHLHISLFTLLVSIHLKAFVVFVIATSLLCPYLSVPLMGIYFICILLTLLSFYLITQFKFYGDTFGTNCLVNPEAIKSRISSDIESLRVTQKAYNYPLLHNVICKGIEMALTISITAHNWGAAIFVEGDLAALFFLYYFFQFSIVSFRGDLNKWVIEVGKPIHQSSPKLQMWTKVRESLDNQRDLLKFVFYHILVLILVGCFLYSGIYLLADFLNFLYTMVKDGPLYHIISLFWRWKTFNP